MNSAPSEASLTAAVAGKRLQGPIPRFAAELAFGGDRPAKPAQDFLVEKRGWRAARPLIDDETDRVRSDVDDADRIEIGEATANEDVVELG